MLVTNIVWLSMAHIMSGQIHASIIYLRTTVTVALIGATATARKAQALGKVLRLGTAWP